MFQSLWPRNHLVKECKHLVTYLLFSKTAEIFWKLSKYRMGYYWIGWLSELIPLSENTFKLWIDLPVNLLKVQPILQIKRFLISPPFSLFEYIDIVFKWGAISLISEDEEKFNHLRRYLIFILWIYFKFLETVQSLNSCFEKHGSAILSSHTFIKKLCNGFFI